MFEAIPRLGMGCWAIGGPFFDGDTPLGWGEVDDAESIRALEASYDAGVRFFDTAAGYGSGHSERLVGQVFGDCSDVVISTKCGFTFDEERRQATGSVHDVEGILAGIDASRTRLQRDCLDLVFLHLNSLPIEDAKSVLEAFHEARARGWIETFGWSTDFPDRASAWAGEEGYLAVQHSLNVFFDAPSLISTIEGQGLWSVNRSPLAMGILSGKDYGSQDFSKDVRANSFEWLDYFKDGKISDSFAQRRDAVRELLSSDGRTLAQGALAWIWALSPRTVPIPGARTEAQAMANAKALDFGPLSPAVMAEIEAVLDRPPEGPPRER